MRMDGGVRALVGCGQLARRASPRRRRHGLRLQPCRARDHRARRAECLARLDPLRGRGARLPHGRGADAHGPVPGGRHKREERHRPPRQPLPVVRLERRRHVPRAAHVRPGERPGGYGHLDGPAERRLRAARHDCRREAVPRPRRLPGHGGRTRGGPEQRTPRRHLPGGGRRPPGDVSDNPVPQRHLHGLCAHPRQAHAREQLGVGGALPRRDRQQLGDHPHRLQQPLPCACRRRLSLEQRLRARVGRAGPWNLGLLQPRSARYDNRPPRRRLAGGQRTACARDGGELHPREHHRQRRPPGRGGPRHAHAARHGRRMLGPRGADEGLARVGSGRRLHADAHGARLGDNRDDRRPARNACVRRRHALPERPPLRDRAGRPPCARGGRGAGGAPRAGRRGGHPLRHLLRRRRRGRDAGGLAARRRHAARRHGGGGHLEGARLGRLGRRRELARRRRAVRRHADLPRRAVRIGLHRDGPQAGRGVPVAPRRRQRGRRHGNARVRGGRLRLVRLAQRPGGGAGRLRAGGGGGAVLLRGHGAAGLCRPGLAVPPGRAKPLVVSPCGRHVAEQRRRDGVHELHRQLRRPGGGGRPRPPDRPGRPTGLHEP